MPLLDGTSVERKLTKKIRSSGSYSALKPLQITAKVVMVAATPSKCSLYIYKVVAVASLESEDGRPQARETPDVLVCFDPRPDSASIVDRSPENPEAENKLI